MIKLIMEKELKEIISSPKFVATFAVCSALILLTFYMGGQNYLLSVKRHSAAIAENQRQLGGLTDWAKVRTSRIILPPQPIEALVVGVSNDIGRSIEVMGRGELEAVDSRYGSDTIYAVFRFLDLNFIFQIVMSLFAILFAYDAISGERERGSLRLVFSNGVPRDKYLIGKLLGAFLAVAAPLALLILLGCLTLPLMGVHPSTGEWGKLALIVLSGFLYFGAFLTLSIFVSASTRKSSNSFLILLVVWVCFVLILPRVSALLAGKAVDVPTIDSISSQKMRLSAQLWRDDQRLISNFRPTSKEMEKMGQEFQEFMQELSKARNDKSMELARQLNEERTNKRKLQESWALALARISPSATFSIAAAKLADTGLALETGFLKQAYLYQKVFADFMVEKTGETFDGRHMIIKMSDSDETPEPIDPLELPVFEYQARPLLEVAAAALPDMAVLFIFNLIFFTGAFVRFRKYDVR